jgi:hypothetical protein
MIAKNANDHERGARVHPASPDLTVAVEAMERYSGKTPPRLNMDSRAP